MAEHLIELEKKIDQIKTLIHHDQAIDKKNCPLMGEPLPFTSSLKNTSFQPSPKVNFHPTPLEDEVNQFLAKLKINMGIIEGNEGSSINNDSQNIKETKSSVLVN